MEEEYQQEYARLYNEHWWWRAREIIITKILREQLTTNHNKILDVGCGEGFSFNFLSAFGDVLGVDPFVDLTNIQEQNISKIKKIAFEHATPDESTFDLVTMMDVLEHIEEDKSAIKNAFKSVKPGGLLLLTVPAFNWLWTYHDDMNYHKRRYTKMDLSKLIVENGFIIESISYLFVWTLPVKILFKILEFINQTRGAKFQIRSHTIPPSWLNQLIIKFCLLEYKLLQKFRVDPLGTSIIVIARKPRI